MRTKAMNAVSYLMAALFFFAVIVQYNDPDSLQWIVVYGAAALTSLLYAWRRLHWLVPALLCAVALVWAGSLASEVIGRTAVPEMFGAWEMKSLAVEEAREFWGLILVAVWSVVLFVAAVRRRSATPSHAST